MTFIPQKTVKGQALTDFLSAYPVSETSTLHKDIPDEVIKANITSTDEVWQMFFDDASRAGPECKLVTGMGVVFVSPHNHVLPLRLFVNKILFL